MPEWKYDHSALKPNGEGYQFCQCCEQTEGGCPQCSKYPPGSRWAGHCWQAVGAKWEERLASKCCYCFGRVTAVTSGTTTAATPAPASTGGTPLPPAPAPAPATTTATNTTVPDAATTTNTNRNGQQMQNDMTAGNNQQVQNNSAAVVVQLQHLREMTEVQRQSAVAMERHLQGLFTFMQRNAEFLTGLRNRVDELANEVNQKIDEMRAMMGTVAQQRQAMEFGQTTCSRMLQQHFHSDWQ